MSMTPTEPHHPPQTALFRRILRNAGTILGGKVAMGLINLAATSIALRSLGVEAMGTILLVHAFSQTADSVAKFQSWQAILRFGTVSLRLGRRAEFRSLLRFTATLDFCSGFASALLAAVAAWWFGDFFGISPAIVPYAVVYATSTLFMATATPTGLLRLFDRFDLLATRDTVGALARLAGAGVAALAGGGLIAFMAVWYLANAVGGLALVISAWRETGRQGLLRAAPGEVMPKATEAHPGLWHFVWTTNLTTTMSLVSGRIGTLCVGAMLGPSEVALYAIARQIGEAALKPGRFLSPAIYPELARLAAAGDRIGLRHLVARVLFMSTGGSLVLLTVLWLLGGELLRLVGGPQTVPAYPVMLLLATASAIGFAGFALEPLLMSVDHQGSALRARSLSALAYLPGALLGLYLYGLEGAGIAAIGTSLVMLAAQIGPVLHALRLSGNRSAVERG
jgi:O-antigen/teichoic acid export membrane protein